MYLLSLHKCVLEVFLLLLQSTTATAFHRVLTALVHAATKVRGRLVAAVERGIIVIGLVVVGVGVLALVETAAACPHEHLLVERMLLLLLVVAEVEVVLSVDFGEVLYVGVEVAQVVVATKSLQGVPSGCLLTHFSYFS